MFNEGLVKIADRLYMEFGRGTFVTTGVTTTVNTKLKKCYALIPVPDVAHTTDYLQALNAPTITTGTITVTRGAGTTSAMTFTYVAIGII